MADSVKVSGFIVLFVGVGALLFTFYNAYLLMMGVLEIGESQDLINLFGEALAPLIVYAIRALYLGIMGWIGSILTRRGVQTVTFEREVTKEKAKPTTPTKPTVEAEKETKNKEAEKEAKNKEAEKETKNKK